MKRWIWVQICARRFFTSMKPRHDVEIVPETLFNKYGSAFDTCSAIHLFWHHPPPLAIGLPPRIIAFMVGFWKAPVRWQHFCHWGHAISYATMRNKKTEPNNNRTASKILPHHSFFVLLQFLLPTASRLPRSLLWSLPPGWERLFVLAPSSHGREPELQQRMQMPFSRLAESALFCANIAVAPVGLICLACAILLAVTVWKLTAFSAHFGGRCAIYGCHTEPTEGEYLLRRYTLQSPKTHWSRCHFCPASKLRSAPPSWNAAAGHVTQIPNRGKQVVPCRITKKTSRKRPFNLQICLIPKMDTPKIVRHHPKLSSSFDMTLSNASMQKVKQCRGCKSA